MKKIAANRNYRIMKKIAANRNYEKARRLEEEHALRRLLEDDEKEKGMVRVTDDPDFAASLADLANPRPHSGPSEADMEFMEELREHGESDLKLNMKEIQAIRVALRKREIWKNKVDIHDEDLELLWYRLNDAYDPTDLEDEESERVNLNQKQIKAMLMSISHQYPQIRRETAVGPRYYPNPKVYPNNILNGTEKNILAKKLGDAIDLMDQEMVEKEMYRDFHIEY